MKSAIRQLALLFLFGAAALVTVPRALAQGQIFDVRNGDQSGKLMIKETEVAFESLTDSKHSRNWAYADIRELTKRKRNDLRIKPKKGSTYDFQLKDRKMRDQIHDLIAERILAARQGGRR